MYIPPANAEHDPAVLFDFIAAHPLGALVTASTEEGLFATHVSFLVDRVRGAHGVLESHIARASPEHRQTLATSEVLVIFTGPDAYLEDRAFLRGHLDVLTARHEAGRERPWAVSDAPDDYIAALERAIVGVEITITRIEGKWKMSQNRSAADIDGVVHGLDASPDERDRAVASIVAERRPASKNRPHR